MSSDFTISSLRSSGHFPSCQSHATAGSGTLTCDLSFDPQIGICTSISPLFQRPVSLRFVLIKVYKWPTGIQKSTQHYGPHSYQRNTVCVRMWRKRQPLSQPLQKTQVGFSIALNTELSYDLQLKCIKGIRSHGLLMPNTFFTGVAHGISLSVHQQRVGKDNVAHVPKGMLVTCRS